MDKSVKQIKPSNRNFGIDLLRCFAMMMVVCLHTLARSGLLSASNGTGTKYEIAWLLEIFSYCAVDCFVIISGYVGLNSKFKISRIVLLWLQVMFYNVSLTAIFQAINHSFDIKALAMSFLPVISGSHWFFTSYFVLCFLMPIINKGILALNKKQCVFALAILIIVFSLIPAICAYPGLAFLGLKEDIFYTNRGYCVLWFAIMYAIGCILNMLKDSKRLVKANGALWALLYTVSALIVFGVHYACRFIDGGISHNFIVSYTSPFVVICAISLLLLFSKFKFASWVNKVIAFFSSGAFAVYIIHSQSSVFPVYKSLVIPISEMRISRMLPALLFTILFVFIVCSSFDFFRAKAEKILHIDKLIKKLDGYMD